MPKQFRVGHQAYPAVLQWLAGARMPYPVEDWLKDQAKSLAKEFVGDKGAAGTTRYRPLTDGKRLRAEISVTAHGYQVLFVEVEDA